MNRYLIVWRELSTGNIFSHLTQYEYTTQKQAIETCFSRWANVLYSFKIKPK